MEEKITWEKVKNSITSLTPEEKAQIEQEAEKIAQEISQKNKNS